MGVTLGIYSLLKILQIYLDPLDIRGDPWYDIY